jgi:RNA polymerase sigma factor (sigma-70 family)
MPGSVVDDSDAGLVEAWRGGDREAGRRLFERHYAAVARFFRNKVGEAGPDLIQRSFLACVEGRERFRHEASFRSYLFSIAYKVLCKHYREMRRDQSREEARVDFEEASVHQLGSMLGAVAARQEQRLLLEGLRRLPVDYQVVLELHYWEGMSGSELAEVLAIPVGTAKTRLRRGRELLEARLGELGSSTSLLQSTLANLDAWAAQLRVQVLGEPE